ncbi:PA domain-containing protein, partial [Arthrospira platensis SPKY1]|nr:PA domain-containing protein [Arthrospira platensis SPKY1]
MEVNDGILDPFFTDGCEEPFVNASELEGKIALIDRGGCLFQLKAWHAEQAGAIGVIICNFEDNVIGMAGSATVDPPSIPTIMISSTTCSLIRGYAGTGLEVTIAEPNITGPSYLSGDYDNGIIAH